MEKTKGALDTIKEQPFHLRTLSKSGGSKYLSLGTIIPPDFTAVKVYALMVDKRTCVLLLEQIS